jgi:transposase InsO family protein
MVSPLNAGVDQHSIYLKTILRLVRLFKRPNSGPRLKLDFFIVDKKRVYRLMKENNLTVKKNQRLIPKRLLERSKHKPVCPNEWWGLDMTKVITDSGWVYMVIVLDF